jgi:hypothetical protein
LKRLIVPGTYHLERGRAKEILLVEDEERAYLPAGFTLIHMEVQNRTNSVQWAIVTGSGLADGLVFLVFKGTSSIVDVIADLGK